MILPTAEVLERRRRGYWRRGMVMAFAVLVMVLSAVLPNIGVEASTAYGRSLIGASHFFVTAEPGAAAFAGTNTGGVALGLDIGYLGLAAQQVGLLAGLGSFWALAAESIGRWIRRLVLLSGWLLAISPVLAVTGVRVLEGAGVPSTLGVAWCFSLVAGLTMILGGLEARKRLDSTWYWTRPDLNG